MLQETASGDGGAIAEPCSEPSIGLGALHFRVGKNKSLYLYKGCSLYGVWHRARPPCLLNVGSIYLLPILLMVQRGRSVGCSCSCTKGACTGKVDTAPIIS